MSHRTVLPTAARLRAHASAMLAKAMPAALAALLLAACGGGGGGSEPAPAGPPSVVEVPGTVELRYALGGDVPSRLVTVPLPATPVPQAVDVQAGAGVTATARLVGSTIEVTLRPAGGSGVGSATTAVDLRLCADTACTRIASIQRLRVRVEAVPGLQVVGLAGRHAMRAGVGVGGPDSVFELQASTAPGRLTVSLAPVPGPSPEPGWIRAELTGRQQLRLRLVTAALPPKGLHGTTLTLRLEFDDGAPPITVAAAVDLEVDDPGCRAVPPLTTDPGAPRAVTSEFPDLPLLVQRIACFSTAETDLVPRVDVPALGRAGRQKNLAPGCAASAARVALRRMSARCPRNKG